MHLTNPTRRIAPHRRYAKKFLTLPDELLTKISDNVALEDLPNFRLTCKTLANISAKHFGEKRLAHRRFIFTEYSIRGLVDMTAHPVIGPRVKSIINITDNAKAMEVLRMYDERRTERSDFQSNHLRWLLREAIANLVHWATRITIGTFDDIQLGLQKKARHLRGYGSGREIKDLPFVRMIPLPKVSLQIIRDASRFITFFPERLVLNLRSEGTDIDTENALCDFMLAGNGQLRPTVDAIIIARYTYIAILSSQGCLTLRRKETTAQDLPEPVYCGVSLDVFDPPMRNAILSAPFRRLNLRSCKIEIRELVMVLQAFAATLQVVDMADVHFWIQDKSQAGRCVRPVLCCLRDELRLRKLILNDIRAMHIDYGDGIIIAKDRTWHSQQTIRQVLDVFVEHDMYAWDFSWKDDSGDENEDGGEVEAGHEDEDEGEAENEEDEGDGGWSKYESILRRRAKKALALALAEP
ncbi:hypothetical protein KCU78_g3502, partial [Aureobasidium melanogenum]